MCFSNKILSNSNRKLLWFEITKMLIAGEKKEICCAVDYNFRHTFVPYRCLQCFDTVGWVAGGHPACKKTEWSGAGVVIRLERGADLHMAQLRHATATHCLLLQ